MKLHAIIRVDVAATEILARPGLVARLRSAFGGTPDLSTGRQRAAIEATAVVGELRQALAELGATNAISLVINDLVVFQDRDRRPDDLGDLFLAFHEYAMVIDADFRALRLAVEHEEAGIHYVVELQARTEFPRDESAIRAVISGRLTAFEPRPGEDAAAYRARVEPLLQQPATLGLARAVFDSFVTRARDAIARAMPEARCEIVAPEHGLVAAPAAPAAPAAASARRRPEDPEYDPHEAHYPNPMLGMLGGALFASALMPAFAAPAAAAAAAAPEASGGDGGGDDGDGGGGGLFDLDW